MKTIQLTILTLSVLAVFVSLAVYADEQPVANTTNQQAVKCDDNDTLCRRRQYMPKVMPKVMQRMTPEQRQKFREAMHKQMHPNGDDNHHHNNMQGMQHEHTPPIVQNVADTPQHSHQHNH